jgi:hypothetical protein
MKKGILGVTFGLCGKGKWVFVEFLVWRSFHCLSSLIVPLIASHFPSSPFDWPSFLSLSLLFSLPPNNADAIERMVK